MWFVTNSEGKSAGIQSHDSTQLNMWSSILGTGTGETKNHSSSDPWTGFSDFLLVQRHAHLAKYCVSEPSCHSNVTEKYFLLPLLQLSQTFPLMQTRKCASLYSEWGIVLLYYLQSRAAGCLFQGTFNSSYSAISNETVVSEAPYTAWSDYVRGILSICSY